jgi:MFS family permease
VLRDRLRGLVGRTFRSIGSRNFRYYFIGQCISATGVWVQRVAELWLVLELTESPVAVGLVTTLNFFPVLILGPLGGLLADRSNKHRLLVITQVLRAAPALWLGLMALSGAVDVWMVYVAAFVTGAATAVDNPGRRAFLQEMVGKELVPNAIALSSTIMTMARVVGPVIAGFTIAFTNIAWAFVLNGCSYLGVLVSLLLMDRSELVQSTPVPRRRGQIREGFRYAWSEPDIRTGLVMMAIVATFSWGAIDVLIALLVGLAFGHDATAFATMFAIMSVGAVIGSLSSASMQTLRTDQVALGAVVLGGSLLALAGTSSEWVAVPLLVLVGIAGSWFITSNNSIVALRAADDFSGRVLALYSAVQLGTRSIGGLVLGWTASAFGPRGAFVLAGATAIAAGLPTLWNRSRLSVPENL